MALLGTYGGDDDVRILQNRILAEQAGALIPDSPGGIIYPGLTLTSLPVMTVTDDPANAGELLIGLSSLGTYDSDITPEVTVKFYANSTIGSSTGAKSLDYITVADGSLEGVSFSTKAHTSKFTRPAVLYLCVEYLTRGDIIRTLKAYTLGTVIQAPATRTATTRAKKGV